MAPLEQKTVEQQSGDAVGMSVAERVEAHIQIARLDHSVKQIFILPGLCWHSR